ncbi:acyl--CoA ligase [soil metagenome]
MTIVNEFRNIWLECADQPLLHEVQRELDYTYGDLAALAIATAKVLQQNYAATTAKILISMDNRVETILTYLACLHLGWVTMPVNPQLTVGEINKIIQLGQPDLFITTDTEWQRFEGTLVGINNVLCWSEEGVLSLKQLQRPSVTEVESFLAGLEVGQLAQLMFTSGTTGLPKTVPIKIERILGNGKLFSQFHQIQAGTTFYNVLPLCYLGGWYNLFLIPVLSRGKVILDDAFGPSNAYGFWDNILQYNISAVWFSPTMLSMLLSIGVDSDFDIAKINAHIRHAFVGMAPLSRSLKQQFEQTFGLRLLENFALSETLFISSEHPQQKINNSVGCLLEGMELKFRDPVTGMSHPTAGEILVRSPYMIDGYYGGLGDSAHTFDAGFFTSGDLGCIDEEGYLFITGRKKEIIIRGGINLSPKEIEDVLYEIPAIREAAVIGVADSHYGERVVAYLTLKDGMQLEEKAVKQHCTQFLTLIKRPAEIIFIEEMPLNSSRKIQKSKLKEMYAQEFSPEVLSNT